MKPGKTGIRRLVAALGYSRQGLVSAYRFEAAFRQELWLALVLVPFALWLDLSLTHTLWLLVSLVMVLIVELINSAIEAVVDRIGPEHHELAGRAKDMGSAAVLLTLLLAVLVWGLILADHLL
ncbi:diacylglycerol kinase [Oceanimonas baumannii]|uniref:Diacylglycerol kinase n=1 Tax=Oceanimonas baumannii TaxID=129578 RepID=A0A235CKF6_9GAMM|nr:diacylglycerol kinase [Oceanimonas baumannii]MCC4265138.1 diacylglycerol kinase [Oceanimonas baumannii]OYD25043.1 diacylglycerol kinase [Oceanimonas baumannii]TDW59823.1 diacylglycerol kinase (ATP) [Oceanimonas baumannii]